MDTLVAPRTCILGFEPQSKDEQANISCHAERSEDRHHVSARPEFLPVQTVLAHLSEELLVACALSEPSDAVTLLVLTLLATEQAGK